MRVTGMMIVNEARKYLGVPFHHQARSRKSGMDCIGLLVVVAQDLDIPIKDIANYRRKPDGVSLIKHLDEQLDPVDALDVGRIVVFWKVKPTYPQHVGIWNGDKLIHTHASAKKVVEEDAAEFMAEGWTIHSIYKYRGVE
jgi:cell wall-associated NlpC family hydrolase